LKSLTATRVQGGWRRVLRQGGDFEGCLERRRALCGGKNTL
jgi:hypothetical protein